MCVQPLTTRANPLHAKERPQSYQSITVRIYFSINRYARLIVPIVRPATSAKFQPKLRIVLSTLVDTVTTVRPKSMNTSFRRGPNSGPIERLEKSLSKTDTKAAWQGQIVWSRLKDRRQYDP